jgi:hypothetical protein
MKMDHGKCTAIVLSYVDDFLITAPTPEIVDGIYRDLAKHYPNGITRQNTFPLKFLGMTLDYDLHAGIMNISQPDGEEKFTQDYSGASSRQVPTPITPQLIAQERGNAVDHARRTYYQRKVGELNWISNTRPDLRFTLSFLAGYLQDPHDREFVILERVAIYLQQHPGREFPLIFRRDSGPTQLIVVTDAAFSPLHSMTTTRGRSRAGVVVMVRNVGCVAYESYSQPYVTTSTAEAETLSMYLGVQRAFPLQHLLKELGEELHEILVLQDNTSTIQRITPDVFRHAASQSKQKYQGIAGYWLGDHLERGELNVVWCPTEENLADVLTKQGDTTAFRRFVDGIRDTSLLSQNFIKMIGKPRLRGCVAGSLLDLPGSMPYNSDYDVFMKCEESCDRDDALMTKGCSPDDAWIA